MTSRCACSAITARPDMFNYSTKILQHYTCKKLDDIPSLAVELSLFFPNPNTIMSGIYELITNAMEHGNLEIGYDYKTLLLKENRWAEEVERRLQDERFRHRLVDLVLYRESRTCVLTITDQGQGFDWQYYLNRTPDPQAYHGRGILIARACDFDEIHFNKEGNQVACIARIG